MVFLDGLCVCAPAIPHPSPRSLQYTSTDTAGWPELLVEIPGSTTLQRIEGYADQPCTCTICTDSYDISRSFSLLLYIALLYGICHTVRYNNGSHRCRYPRYRRHAWEVGRESERESGKRECEVVDGHGCRMRVVVAVISSTWIVYSDICRLC